MVLLYKPWCALGAYHGPGPRGPGGCNAPALTLSRCSALRGTAEHCGMGAPQETPASRRPAAGHARRPVCCLGARSRPPGRPLAGAAAAAGGSGPCARSLRGRSACRLSVPPAASGRGSPPGGAAAAPPCPGVGGLASPPPRPTGRGSWAPVSGGPARLAGGRSWPPPPVSRAPSAPPRGPPAPALSGSPAGAMGCRWQLPPGGAQGRPRAAFGAARAPGSRGFLRLEDA